MAMTLYGSFHNIQTNKVTSSHMGPSHVTAPVWVLIMILLLCHLLITKVKVIYAAFIFQWFHFVTTSTLMCLSKPNTFNIILTY